MELLEDARRLKLAGRMSEAELTCRQLVVTNPLDPDIWQFLGEVAFQNGDDVSAIRYFGQAVTLQPNHAAAQNGLGLAFLRQRRWYEAIASFQLALSADSSFAEAHRNLGDAYYDLRRLDDAAACYRRTLELRPDLAAAHYNLGAALKDQGKLDEAAVCFDRALELNPALVEARFNLGYVRQCQGKFEEAIACNYQVLAQRPSFIEAYLNLGNVFLEQQKLDEAATSFRRAVELNPNSGDAHCQQSLVMLLKGDFQQGWREYEWRWKTADLRPRHYDRPEWIDQDLRGKRILLHAEQGLGDAIHFVRYASLVKSLGAVVFLECHKPLLKLFSCLRDIDRLVGHRDEPPEYDFHAPLLSLPARFNTTLDTVPARIPYLFADPQLVANWREALRNVPGFRIGINWRGGMGRLAKHQRNLPLGGFAKIAKLPGVTLVNLQRGAKQELAAASGDLPIVDLGEHVDQENGAFMDTAAIMQNLDLVITSDTSVAHLAGALGVSVWTALRFAADWRWLLDRGDSPWYPTMRLFRQKTPGEWNGVFEDICSALEERLATDQKSG